MKKRRNGEMVHFTEKEIELIKKKLFSIRYPQIQYTGDKEDMADNAVSEMKLRTSELCELLEPLIGKF